MFEPTTLDVRGSLRRKMSVAFSQRFLTHHQEEFERVLDMRLPWVPDQESLLNQAAAVAGFDVLDRLRGLFAPTLIVAGTDDRVVPYENSLILHSHIGPSALHLFRGAGHLVHIECYKAFNSLVGRFVREVEAGSFMRREAEEDC